ncbi:OmpA family protein [Pseudooceanicola sp. C21-150M6]|uniref:OmpA family protein n=1 Tax=Pseudooceanicola sp. C21-150M6 TaxID=3434355 RepID=UPI003D7FA906
MTPKFLKSSTAIVLSLALAVPHAAIAQANIDPAEVDAVQLDIDTSGMTEAEIQAAKLKKFKEERREARAEAKADRQAERAAKQADAQADANAQADAQAEGQDAEPSAVQAGTNGTATADAAASADPAQDKSALDKAVSAVTDKLGLTEEEPDATADASAEATADAAPQAAPEASTDVQTEAQAEVQPEAPAAEAEAEAQPQSGTTVQNADVAPEAAANDAPVTAETAPEPKPADTANASATDAPATAQAEPAADADKSIVESTVDKVRDGLAGALGVDTAQETPDTPAPDAAATTTADASGEAQGDAPTEEQAAQIAEAQAQQEAEAAAARTTAAAAASGDTEAAEVVEEQVTEENSRASTEEFVNQSTAAQTGGQAAEGQAQATASADTGDKDEGLSDLGKIALFGLGALAVGQMLKNGNEVVSNTGDRVVVQQPDGSYRVYKNDDELIRRPGTDVKTYAYNDGSTRTVATRDDGIQIETVRAADGTVLRRSRILPDGREVILFDDTQVAEAVQVNQLPQVTETSDALTFQSAQEDELRAALEGRLRSDVDRRFSLSQVRSINAVRNLAPEIAVDSINFETGSSAIRPEEAEELAQLGSLMRQMIDRDPGEVFLIEGHTDAVGSASSNLALSDRRAESVALALTEYFDVPPENMVVQGYGEYDLKVRTAAAERENRRAAVRNITELLQDRS